MNTNATDTDNALRMDDDHDFGGRADDCRDSCDDDYGPPCDVCHEPCASSKYTPGVCVVCCPVLIARHAADDLFDAAGQLA